MIFERTERASAPLKYNGSLTRGGAHGARTEPRVHPPPEPLPAYRSTQWSVR